MHRQRLLRITSQWNIGLASLLVLFFLLFLGSLAASRILYELTFPHLLWLGRPLPALLLAGLVAVLVAGIWWQRRQHAVILSPLLLNLLYLFDPTVNLIRSRLIFAASLWLVTLLLARRLVHPKAWRWLGVVFVAVALLPVYLLTMPDSVGRADTFEFQVVTPQLGIAHPTGYPLYLLLGKLFTLLPAGSVAWRLNFASAVYALVAVSLICPLAYRLLQRPLPAVLGAMTLGLTPAFWSQAIEAEVYTLHALIVAAALWLMLEIGDWRLSDGPSGIGDWRLAAGDSALGRRLSQEQTVILLFFVIGLGLTNHLTSLFLILPAMFTLLLTFRRNLESLISNPSATLRTGLQSLSKVVIAFLLPLSLYAYLPLRWAAVNEEPMGFERFVDWVIGGRFQGALQWSAWLDDPTRYEVIGRLFLDNWGWFNLLLALIGFVFLVYRHWRPALVLFVTWFGFTFYCLNYYVPDLAVFLIPAHLVVAICWAAGLREIGDWPMCHRSMEHRRLAIGDWRLSKSPVSGFQPLIFVLLLIPALLLVVRHWPQVDRSRDDGLTQWGRAVLELPLDASAAILADSEKVAPLYYLQQSEGVRPDLDILVLPDEAAYRAELDRRIAAGQTLYLARFLPGLAGNYHLRSLGPLIEVSTGSLKSLPEGATSRQTDFGAIRLVGTKIEAEAAADPAAAAVTLYWQATERITEVRHVYVRWAGDHFTGEPDVVTGQHPASNTYPTNAWRPGEIVCDYHQSPRPILNEAQTLTLQVALAPPFASSAELDWQNIVEVDFAATDSLDRAQPLRAQIGPLLLDGIQHPQQVRPQTPLPVLISGYGEEVDSLQLSLRSVNNQGAKDELQVAPRSLMPNLQSPFVHATELSTDLPNGHYQLIASQPLHSGRCGWLALVTNDCTLGEIEISGVPLPEGAVNFDDRIALLELEMPEKLLRPGGQFPLTLTWQALTSIDHDYTVFVQILDDQDRIVGQVDTWPRQGTHATSQWAPGEIVRDPYVVPLQGDLPPGEYRLQLGWYLLATLRRLPVLDESGTPIDDKVVVPGLFVP
ncbi:MAG TPA: DUF2723 domain-containing protein [Anaerolineae bacterium]